MYRLIVGEMSNIVVNMGKNKNYEGRSLFSRKLMRGWGHIKLRKIELFLTIM